MWAMGSLVVDPRDRDHWMATEARAYSVAYRHADDTFALCVSGKSLPGEGGVYLSLDAAIVP